MVVGHQKHVERLQEELPRVSLFLGPDSVGKTSLAFQVIRQHGADLVRVQSLTMDEARGCSELAMLAPIHDLRVIMIDLDGASADAQAVLLKALEEAPTTTRFILIASELPLPTIVSRAEVFRFSLLSEADVAEILVRKKFNSAEAKKLAALAGGQVSRALKFVNTQDARIVVLSAIRAVRERDSAGLENLSSRWADEHTELLAQLCREAITGRWTVFQAAEVEGMPNRLALAILIALRANIRPRLVVRSSLMTVMREAA